MTKMNAMEMRNIEGGASKYVYCPNCGYKYKTTLLERLFRNDATVRYYLSANHGYYKNIKKGWKYARSQSVHY